MYTERLYYLDPYLRDFAARVIDVRAADGKLAVALDRTAFYPTGGGQPNDMGVLAWPSGEARVLDVTSDDGLVWHTLEREDDPAVLVGVEVYAAVDWRRRFDHMQQHTGQHVLSQAFVQACSAETVAFHLGAAASTIDLDRAGLGADALAAAEAAANDIVDRALPVSATFVTPEELARLPLRKPPKVTENVRIVQVEGFDWSACGGTHVTNTAQVGLIKITGSERRGNELRVTFLCGGRARADYARLQAIAQGLVARFTTGQDEALDAIDRRAAEMDALRKDLGELEKQWVEATAAALYAAAEPRGPYRVVSLAVDYPVERARRVAQAVRARPGAVVLLGVTGERPQLIFSRADDSPVDAGALLKTAVAAGGGRGGGRPDWAQGGLPTFQGLQLALQAALDSIPGA
jgi:alanyl-tRNA synthetase